MLSEELIRADYSSVKANKLTTEGVILVEVISN